MQTFQTAAVVGLIDNMSGPLKDLARHAKAAAKGIEVAKLDPNGVNAYASGIARANTNAKQHLGIVQGIRQNWNAVGGLMAGVAASKLAHGSIDAVRKYAPLESETRYQKAVGNYTDAEMRDLDKQRVEAVDKWGMKLLDTTHAQQVFTTRNFSAPITKAATEASIVLGRALNVGAADAGKVIEGLVFGQGIHLKDPASASKETSRMADMAAIAAKKGAMSPEDIKQFAIYGVAPGTAAGLSPEQMFAAAMTFKRANIDGTQAGTFTRAISSRLMAPTTMGRDALALMLQRHGRSLDEFTGGVDLTPEGIDAALAQNAKGRRLGKKGIASLHKSIDDGIDSDDPTKDVMGSRANFAAAIRKALEDSGQKFDQGEIPKMVGHALRMRDIASQKMKTGELFDFIVKNATQSEWIKFAGDKQGGRAASLNSHQYEEYLAAQKDSQGYAQKIAEERMVGFAAALTRLESATDNVVNRMVQANEGWASKVMNSGADTLSWLSNLSDGAKQAATGLLGIGTLWGAIKAYKTGAAIVGGLTGAEAAAGGAAAGGVFSAGAAPVAALTATGALATAFTSAQIKQMTEEQRKAVISNPFAPDLAFGAAIIGAGDDRTETRYDKAPYNPMWEKGVKPVVDHIADTFSSLRKDAYDIFSGNYGNVGKNYPKGEGEAAQPVSVQGEVTGKADVNLVAKVEPSTWFMTTIHQIQNDIVTLKGSLGSDKTGTGMSGSNGARPAFNPATNAP